MTVKGMTAETSTPPDLDSPGERTGSVTPTSNPRPIARRAQVGITAVAVTAAVLSFSSLRELAIATGTPEPIAWLFPITLDAAAGVAMFVWMRSMAGHVVQYARRLTTALAVTSILCNSVNHGFKAIVEDPPWWKLTAVLAVGTIPPIVFVTVVHMVFLARQPEPWGGPDAVTVPPEVPVETAPPTVEIEPVDATPVETTRRALTPRVTTPLRRTPKPAALMPVPSESRDEQPAERPTSRRCDHQACGRLLPPGSRADRKFCDATCRQAASRASRSAAVTA